MLYNQYGHFLYEYNHRPIDYFWPEFTKLSKFSLSHLNQVEQHLKSNTQIRWFLHFDFSSPNERFSFLEKTAVTMMKEGVSSDFGYWTTASDWKTKLMIGFQFEESAFYFRMVFV